MSTKRVVVVYHQSPLRDLTEAEALDALQTELRLLPRTIVELDSRILREDIEGGHWDPADAWVRRTAAELRDAAAGGSTELHHFGLPEVPIMVGLGAHYSDELRAYVHDQTRTGEASSVWVWPSSELTLTVEHSRLPSETVAQSGEAVLIVEVSYPVDQRLVDSVVGNDVLATVRVSPTGDSRIEPSNVRSSLDVDAVREKVRTAIAAIREYRPSTERLHLFIAAPPSVCFAVGQELQLRNSFDVQTYRYRRDDATDPYKPALLLTSRINTAEELPLSDEERQLAVDLRDICSGALKDVQKHALDLAGSEWWYSAMQPADELATAAPFSSLEPLTNIVDREDRFDRTPRHSDYEFSKENRSWRMSDRLVLAFFRASNEDRGRMRQLVRLFFYHEYLHDWQDLTKYTADDVGSFANCLETIDYMADTYALLHQLDYAIRYSEPEFKSPGDQRAFLVDQIGLAISSFWAFEDAPPQFVWQERRLRRYLNWYWRRVQLRGTELSEALRTLARQPHIEVAGLQYRTGRGRHFVVLNKVRTGDVIEIGLVLEDGRFTRRGTTTDLSIEAAMIAFAEHEREQIDRFFNSLYEHNRQTQGVVAPQDPPTRQ